MTELYHIVRKPQLCKTNFLLKRLNNIPMTTYTSKRRECTVLEQSTCSGMHPTTNVRANENKTRPSEAQSSFWITIYRRIWTHLRNLRDSLNDLRNRSPISIWSRIEENRSPRPRLSFQSNHFNKRNRCTRMTGQINNQTINNWKLINEAWFLMICPWSTSTICKRYLQMSSEIPR